MQQISDHARRRDLTNLGFVWPREIDDTTKIGRLRLIRRLEGAARHWVNLARQPGAPYSYPLHCALMAALKAERAAFDAVRADEFILPQVAFATTIDGQRVECVATPADGPAAPAILMWCEINGTPAQQHIWDRIEADMREGRTAAEAYFAAADATISEMRRAA